MSSGDHLFFLPVPISQGTWAYAINATLQVLRNEINRLEVFVHTQGWASNNRPG